MASSSRLQPKRTRRRRAPSRSCSATARPTSTSAPQNGKNRAGKATSTRPECAGRRRSAPVIGLERRALAVAIEAELHQAPQQLLVLEAGGAPELGKHADGGEPGDGVDLVYHDLARRLL